MKIGQMLMKVFIILLLLLLLDKNDVIKVSYKK